MPIHTVFLKYFVEVRRCGSIRLAARNLNVSSSAVNRQILKIEDELGTALFDRTTGGLQITPAGEILALHIDRTLADAEQTFAQIANQKGDSRSLIKIAGQESVIARFLPPALLELHAELPDISTVFKASSGNQLQQLLHTEDVDIALTFDPEPSDSIDIKRSITLPVGAVLPARHPLADRDHVSLADCIPFPIVLPDSSWPLRSRLDSEIDAAGLTLNIITSSNSVEFIKSMVDQDLGLGFQTVIGIESQLEKGEFRHIPLIQSAPVTQEFALCTKTGKEITPVIDRVLSLLINRLSHYSL